MGKVGEEVEEAEEGAKEQEGDKVWERATREEEVASDEVSLAY